MAFCPQCRHEFKPGVVRCAECDVDLVAQLPAEPEWVKVYSGNFAGAAVAQSALEAAGIETFNPKESIFPDAGIDVESSYGVEIFVAEEDAAEARKILQGMDRMESEEVPPDAAPSA